MSKIGGEIIDGLRDALKYAEGETKDNKEHRVLIMVGKSWVIWPTIHLGDDFSRRWLGNEP